MLCLQRVALPPSGHFFTQSTINNGTSNLCTCKSRTRIYVYSSITFSSTDKSEHLCSQAETGCCQVRTVSVWSLECMMVYRTVNECTGSNLLCGTSKDSPTALRITSASVWTLKIPTKKLFSKGQTPDDKAIKSLLNRKKRALRALGQGGS